MKIVVLDGHGLNPGDLPWDALAALGDLKVFNHTEPDQIPQRAGTAEAVLTHMTALNREAIRKIAALRYIGVLGPGSGGVNVEAAHKRGVVVTHVPDAATAAVAEMVFAVALEFARRVSLHAHSVRKGRWSRTKESAYWLEPMGQLDGLTMGIVGYGRVGKAVARRALAFGMRVLIHTRTPGKAGEGVEFTDLDSLIAASDIITLHCPLATGTERLINAERLARMKPSALLINTSRGGLVDEEALAAALRAKKIAGAALDGLAEEPPPMNHPLFRAPNCLVTPHHAWATIAARRLTLETAARNLKAFQEGRAVNVL